MNTKVECDRLNPKECSGVWTKVIEPPVEGGLMLLEVKSDFGPVYVPEEPLIKDLPTLLGIFRKLKPANPHTLILAEIDSNGIMRHEHKLQLF
jgi:hypothetical protein